MRDLPLDHPGTADARSPWRFLWWTIKGQWHTIALGMVFGVIWMTCSAVVPVVIGKAIDAGVTARDSGALWSPRAARTPPSGTPGTSRPPRATYPRSHRRGVAHGL